MKIRQLLVLIIGLFVAIEAFPQSSDEVWHELLKAINFVEVSKAGFKSGCQEDNPLSSTHAYKMLCPKLDDIPASTIEAAAFPYLKRHVAKKLIPEAIAFWQSDRGRELTKKILKEIETGQFTYLDPEDLKLLSKINKTEYGQALYAFSSDNAQAAAVARAMLHYAPQ